jgi:hypothetical protein
LTFLSGGYVGRVSELAPSSPPRHTVDFVYQDAFDALKATGHNEAEIEEARTIYKEYLKNYQLWWDSVLETHPEIAGPIDQHFHDRMDALAERSRARQAAEK